MNFKEFEEMINGEAREISINEDVILDDNEVYKKGIEINRKGLIINGNGHTIDANNLGKAFNIQADNITLKDINLKQCISHKGNGGGAIENWGKHLSIKHCYFSNNQATNNSGGGAIYSFEDIELEDCIFENNTSIESDGGAIFLDTIGDYPIRAVLRNCEFKNNRADGQFKDFGSNAGAVYNKKSYLFLFDCNFEDNGVISAYMSNSESILNEEGLIIMDNCCFKTRKSHSIFNRGVLILDNSRFYHDFKSGLEIRGSIFNRGSVGLLYDENNLYNAELNGERLNISNINDLINEYKTMYDKDTGEETVIYKKNSIKPVNPDDYRDCEYLKSLSKNNIDMISCEDYEDSDC